MSSAFVKIKKWIKSALRVILNPRLLLCFVIAWMITNGWCYLAIIFGASFGVTWLTLIGTAYAGFLWFPFTPEKIVTVLLSIFLLRLLFPHDEQTLKFLTDKLSSLRRHFRERRASKHKNSTGTDVG